jgi:hypothetical protein
LIANRALLLSIDVAWWRRTDESLSTVAEDAGSPPEPHTSPQVELPAVPKAGPPPPDRVPSPWKRDVAKTDGSAPFPIADAEARKAAPTELPNGTNSSEHSPNVEGGKPMNDHSTALKGAMQIEGALGVALVDSTSGMALGTAGSPVDLDLEVAAAGNSNVIQAKHRTMADLGLSQSIEDILITLDKQYHIIRPLARQNTLFLYLVLDRARANLAMARFKLAGLEQNLKV